MLFSIYLEFQFSSSPPSTTTNRAELLYLNQYDIYAREKRRSLSTSPLESRERYRFHPIDTFCQHVYPSRNRVVRDDNISIWTIERDLSRRHIPVDDVHRSYIKLRIGSTRLTIFYPIFFETTSRSLTRRKISTRR